MGPSIRKSPIAYFVRHGETVSNKNGMFRGAIDIPLDTKGKQQAKELGDYFKNIPISRVFSSPKNRAKDTAEAIARPKKLNVTVLNGLKAIDVGYLSGEKKSDHLGVMDYFQKFPQEHIPMGDSIDSFRQQSQPDIQKILDYGMQSDVPPVAAVHSSIIHEVNHMLTGDHQQTLVEPGGAIAVYHHPEYGFKIKAVLNPEIESKDNTYTG